MCKLLKKSYMLSNSQSTNKSYSNLRFASAGPTSTLMTIANEKTNMRSSRLKPGNVLPVVVELTRWQHFTALEKFGFGLGYFGLVIDGLGLVDGLVVDIVVVVVVGSGKGGRGGVGLEPVGAGLLRAWWAFSNDGFGLGDHSYIIKHLFDKPQHFHNFFKAIYSFLFRQNVMLKKKWFCFGEHSHMTSDIFGSFLTYLPTLIRYRQIWLDLPTYTYI